MKKEQIEFYEGLYAVQLFWLVICCLALIISVFFLKSWNIYPQIVIIVIYFLIFALILLLAKRVMKKICISKKGIYISKKGKVISFYQATEIELTKIESKNLIDSILSQELFLWLFRLNYLQIQIKDEKVIILIGRKHIKIIKKLLNICGRYNAGPSFACWSDHAPTG